MGRFSTGRMLVTAALVFSALMFVGCGGDEGGNPSGPDNSSGTTFVDKRDSKTYKKVKIGSQTWMAENLNYDVPNDTADKCYNNSPDSLREVWPSV